MDFEVKRAAPSEETVRLDGWLMFALAVITSAVGLSAAAFTVFETKEHAKEIKDSTEHRLERIESKIDKLLEK